jgi:hypothetical protein
MSSLTGMNDQTSSSIGRSFCGRWRNCLHTLLVLRQKRKSGKRYILPAVKLEARPIIIITHDESIFSANDGRRQEHEIFFVKGKGIMVSDFLLPRSWLNLYSLPKTRQELGNSGVLLEAAILFEYVNVECLRKYNRVHRYYLGDKGIELNR